MGKIKFIREREEKKESPERMELAAKPTGKVMLAEENKRTVLFEDITRREPNAKHFRMSDGTFKAVCYSSPVHYYDEEEGKYIAADSVPAFCAADAADEEDFDGYENRGVDFKVKLSQYAEAAI